jgi:hypothetical protein
MVAIAGFCPFYHQAREGKPPSSILGATILHGFAHRAAAAGQSNPVESAGNIAFANAITTCPKAR